MCGEYLVIEAGIFVTNYLAIVAYDRKNNLIKQKLITLTIFNSILLTIVPLIL